MKLFFSRKESQPVNVINEERGYFNKKIFRLTLKPNEKLESISLTVAYSQLLDLQHQVGLTYNRIKIFTSIHRFA